MGNVGSSTFQWNPKARLVVQRPSPYGESFRNDPGQGSDNRPKVTGLKSESVPGFIPES